MKFLKPHRLTARSAVLGPQGPRGHRPRRAGRRSAVGTKLAPRGRATRSFSTQPFGPACRKTSWPLSFPYLLVAASLATASLLAKNLLRPCLASCCPTSALLLPCLLQLSFLSNPSFQRLLERRRSRAAAATKRRVNRPRAAAAATTKPSIVAPAAASSSGLHDIVACRIIGLGAGLAAGRENRSLLCFFQALPRRSVPAAGPRVPYLAN